MASNGVVRIAGARGEFVNPGFFEWNGSGFSFTPVPPLLTNASAVSYRISPDAQWMVGYSESPNTDVGNEAVLWNVATPSALLALGFLSSSVKDSMGFSIGIQSNEVVAVGNSNSREHGTTGFRWTPTGGMTELPLTGLPSIGSGATGISTNGSKWCGYEDPPGFDSFRAVIGDSSGARALETFGNTESDAVNISRDGTVVLGSIGLQAAFWSGTNYAPTLGILNSAPLLGKATAAEAGLVVGVGHTETGGDFGWVASLTNGVGQTASNWLAQQYGLSVTNNVTDAMDILQSGNRLFIVFNTTSGAALFTSANPSIDPPAPSLSIFQLPPDHIQLRWPTNRLCTLESTPNLNAPRVWTALTNPAPQSSNGQFLLTLPASNAQFFRLNCP